MGFRTTTEIEASFRRAEQKLDAMLEDVQVCLERERINSFDESNRSGFDGGFPNFVWGFRFEKRENFGSEIKRAAARFSYREPALEEDSQTIEVTSIAEIFQIGKQSRVVEIKQMVYPLEQFLSMRMGQVIIDSIAGAERVLAKY